MASGHEEPTENRPLHGSKTEDVRESSLPHDHVVTQNSQESEEFVVHHNSNEDNEIKSQSSSDEDRDNESPQNNKEECDNKSKPNSTKYDERKFSPNSHSNSKLKQSKSSDSDADTEKEISNAGDDMKSSRSPSSELSRSTRQTTPEKEHNNADSPATPQDELNNTSGNNPVDERITTPKPAAPTPAHGTTAKRMPDWQTMQIGFDFHNWPVAIFRGSGTWRRPDRVDERRQVARLSHPKRPISPDHWFDGWVNHFSRYWDIQLGQDRRDCRDGRSHTAGKGNPFQRGHGDNKSENQNNSHGGRKKKQNHPVDNSSPRQGRRRGRSHKKGSGAGRLLGRPQTTPPNVRPNESESDGSRSERRLTSLKRSEERRGQGPPLPPIGQDQKSIPGLKRSYSGLRTPSREEMDQMIKRHTRMTSSFQAKTSPNPN